MQVSGVGPTYTSSACGGSTLRAHARILVWKWNYRSIRSELASASVGSIVDYYLREQQNDREFSFDEEKSYDDGDDQRKCTKIAFGKFIWAKDKGTSYGQRMEEDYGKCVTNVQPFIISRCSPRVKVKGNAVLQKHLVLSPFPIGLGGFARGVKSRRSCFTSSNITLDRVIDAFTFASTLMDGSQHGTTVLFSMEFCARARRVWASALLLGASIGIRDLELVLFVLGMVGEFYPMKNFANANFQVYEKREAFRDSDSEAWIIHVCVRVVDLGPGPPIIPIELPDLVFLDDACSATSVQVRWCRE
ncbi:hypothetical protein SCHPADRAFT_980187 [Schizopora paradoxa]|uniref:Uncharacterized protein n=1 Tax=Schizopora paradoxa TaxID=27342 RepID=A0A0H2RBV3_9AGAM|nr:hypothetical protein SCHPADRAFT_980187 [Schizopora paradoxa]